MATNDRGRQAGTTETYTDEQGHRRQATQMQGHHAIREIRALDEQPGNESLPASSAATLRQCQKDGCLEKCGTVSSTLSIVAALWLSSGTRSAPGTRNSQRDIKETAADGQGNLKLLHLVHCSCGSWACICSPPADACLSTMRVTSKSSLRSAGPARITSSGHAWVLQRQHGAEVA
eukprot:1291246-Prymnesium_polylepis.1